MGLSESAKKQTRTRTTEEFYAYLFDLKMPGVKSHAGDGDVTAKHVQEYLEAIRERVSYSSFRVYKAAFVQGLKSQGVQGKDLDAVADVQYRDVDRTAYKDRVAVGDAGHCAYKSKGLADKDLERIQIELRDMFSTDNIEAMDDYAEGVSEKGINWYLMLYLYFATNKHVGLRPNEISGLIVTEDSDRILIEARNSKNTNNRAIGETRRITIIKREFDNMSGDGESEKLFARLQLLQMTANRFVATNGKKKLYDRMYQTFKSFKRNKMPHLLKRKKSITLYSVRHYFIASARKAGLSPAEIAALVGHASDNTARVHYGGVPIKYRGAAVGVKADQDAVAKVRAVYEKSRSPKGLMKIKQEKRAKQPLAK